MLISEFRQSVLSCQNHWRYPASISYNQNETQYRRDDQTTIEMILKIAEYYKSNTSHYDFVKSWFEHCDSILFTVQDVQSPAGELCSPTLKSDFVWCWQRKLLDGLHSWYFYLQGIWDSMVGNVDGEKLLTASKVCMSSKGQLLKYPCDPNPLLIDWYSLIQ